MSHDVLTKDIAERRITAGGLAAVLALLAFGAFAVDIALDSTLGDLTDGFPEVLTALVGGDGPASYVVGEIFSLLAPIALVAYAVLTGASAAAGEETTGTMSMLSAQPVSRRDILTGKLLGLLGTLVVLAAVFAGVGALGAAVFDSDVTPGNVLATGVHLLLLAVFFGSVAFAVGAATGSASIAAGAAGALAAVSYLTSTMLPIADLNGAAEFSPWFYYEGSTPLANGIQPWHLLLLAGLSAAALAVTYVMFERRDLKG